MENTMWDYYIQDNFLSEVHYDFLEKYEMDPGNFELFIDDTGEINFSKYPSENTFSIRNQKELLNTLLEIHEDVGQNILKFVSNNSERKVAGLKYSLVVSPNGLDYNWHPDREDKIYSSITYIGDTNWGTIVGKEPNDPKAYPIEWKENRNFSFFPTKDTWHKWKAIGDRKTLCIFAVDENYLLND